MDLFATIIGFAVALGLLFGFLLGLLRFLLRRLARPFRRPSAAKPAQGAPTPAQAGVGAAARGLRPDFVEANFAAGDRDTITGTPFSVGDPVFQCAWCRAVYAPLGRVLVEQNHGGRCVRCNSDKFWQTNYLEPFTGQPGRHPEAPPPATGGPPSAPQEGTWTTAKGVRPLPAPPRRRGRKVARFLRAAAIILLVFVVAPALYLNHDTPTGAEIREIVGRPTVEVWRKDGEIVFGEEVFPVPVRVEETPELLKDAIIEIEDRRFRRHPGIDPIGMATAVGSYGLALATGREARMRGASTITQQVAKNLFLTSDRSVVRKLREIWLALKLTAVLSKDEVLELYLNRVFLGGANYGVELAARDYFGVRARNLNPYQAAMLAGIISRPNPANPRRDTRAAHERARIVLATLARRGRISSAERNRLMTRWSGVPFSALQTGTRSVPRIDRGWIEDWLVRELAEASYVGDKPVRLTLAIDPLAQVYAQLAARRLADTGRNGGGFDSVAVVVMAPDGGIRGLVGGANRRLNQFNNAIQARRPMASTFKPIVYLDALRRGMTPATMIVDRPIDFEGRNYPRNFDGTYYGEVTVETALARSLNAAAVRLGDSRYERRGIIELARHLGLTGPFADEPSLPLGTAPATPLEVASVYAALANGGYPAPAWTVAAAQGLNGRMVYRRPPHERRWPVAEPRHVATLNRMLNQAATRGTGHASAFSRNVAGKTGTSQDSRDAWFAGYTSDLVGVVWVGNSDNRRTRNVTGGGAPASAFGNLMANIYDGTSPTAPPGVR